MWGGKEKQRGHEIGGYAEVGRTGSIRKGQLGGRLACGELELGIWDAGYGIQDIQDTGA